VRRRFAELVEATRWRPGAYDLSLLCIHHCVEGARVGPADFTFRRGGDVIRCADLPSGAAVVLTGHVHRHQTLSFDPAGRPLRTPVIYPGSVERTAFAEMGEQKGFVVLDLERASDPGRWRVRVDFRPLPTRPMAVRDVRAAGLDRAGLRALVDEAVSSAPPDAVLRLRVQGPVDPGARTALAARRLRALAPGKNIEVVQVEGGRGRKRGARAARGRRGPGTQGRERRRASELDLFGAPPAPAAQRS
jgi:DNA repair exonuclease SbcCD nuclease subunit